jgi:Flp pilus assembly protein TadD
MSQFFRTTALALSLAFLCTALPALSQDAKPADEAGADTGPANPGAYLAARVAGAESDFAAAATWYTRALLANPENPMLQEGAILSNIGVGRVENAITIADQLNPGGVQSQAAMIAILADQAKRGDFEGILKAAKGGRETVALLDELSTGWAELGAGRMSEAQTAFDKLSKTGGVEVFGLFHKALSLASVGDFEGADAIFSGPAGSAIEGLRRGVIAHAEVLSQLERNPDAIALLDRVFPGGNDPGITVLRARLEAGEPVPFDIVRNATDGIAEVFFTLATELNGEADDAHTLIHARIAAWLRPDHTEAQLLTAGLLNRLGQPDLATETYALISPDDPSYHIAEMGRAEALVRAGKSEAAIEVMTALARTHGHIIGVQQELGTLLRREEKFEAAIAAYDAAISLLGDKVSSADWGLFFERGICQERQRRWDMAEADLRKALELKPDQPQVLNYLGYSYLERNVKMDEALSMIERAVRAEPESGYIVDSLAWGYYRTGRYQDALAPMEKASLLEPVDPVVTDHLGDIYWAVGRTLEAEFQWHRALSLKPEDKDADRIRRKIAVGLDKVLAEEGAKPITAQTAQDGN